MCVLPVITELRSCVMLETRLHMDRIRAARQVIDGAGVLPPWAASVDGRDQDLL